jgi:hypothetical protein
MYRGVAEQAPPEIHEGADDQPDESLAVHAYPIAPASSLIRERATDCRFDRDRAVGRRLILLGGG